MAQYHIVANLDKRVGYSPESVGSYAKLSELSHTVSPMGSLILLLMQDWYGDRVCLVGNMAKADDLSDEAIEAAGLSPEHIRKAVIDPQALKDYFDIDAEELGWDDGSEDARGVLEDEGLVTFTAEERRLINRPEAKPNTLTRYEFALNESSDFEEDNPEVVLFNMDRQQVLIPESLGDGPTLHEIITRGYMGGTLTALSLLLAASCKGGGRHRGDFFYTHSIVGSWAGDRIAVVTLGEAEGYEDITSRMRQVLYSGGEGEYKVNQDGSVQRNMNLWK